MNGQLIANSSGVSKVKRYYPTLMISAAGALAIVALAAWRPANGGLFLAELVLAGAAAMWKIETPSLPGSFSTGCIPVLIAVDMLSLPEVAIIAACATIVEYVWRSESEPSGAMCAFHTASAVVAAAAAYSIDHLSTGFAWVDHTLISYAAACLIYCLIHITFLSQCAARSEGVSLSDTWRACYLGLFPYYLGGAAVATLAVSWARRCEWAPMLLLVPLAGCACFYCRTFGGRQSNEPCRW
jgi:hypothetical protein